MNSITKAFYNIYTVNNFKVFPKGKVIYLACRMKILGFNNSAPCIAFNINSILCKEDAAKEK